MCICDGCIYDVVLNENIYQKSTICSFVVVVKSDYLSQ